MMKKTYDYLNGTNIYLYQRKDMFRINTDTSLLGKFYSVKSGESILDIGCNNGALLLYSKDVANVKRVGIDIQKEAIDLAAENFMLNNTDCELICCDVKDYQPNIKFDVIICNPPYFKVNNDKLVNDNEYLKIARHEVNLPLIVLFESIARLLNNDGRMYLVHRATRMPEIIEIACKYDLKPKTIQLVFDDNKEEAISVLIMFVKGTQSDCKILKPIYIKR